jgi:hypothetical protein
VVVTKTLHDDAKVQERFPKRRMPRKRKANDQMIPVEDVIRGIEGYAETIEPEVQRRVEGVNMLANRLLDEETARQKHKAKATLDLASRMVSKEKARTRFQAAKTGAASAPSKRW